MNSRPVGFTSLEIFLLLISTRIPLWLMMSMNISFYRFFHLLIFVFDFPPNFSMLYKSSSVGLECLNSFLTMAQDLICFCIGLIFLSLE